MSSINKTLNLYTKLRICIDLLTITIYSFNTKIITSNKYPRKRFLCRIVCFLPDIEKKTTEMYFKEKHSVNHLNIEIQFLCVGIKRKCNNKYNKKFVCFKSVYDKKVFN